MHGLEEQGRKEINIRREKYIAYYVAYKYGKGRKYGQFMAR
jgi:hypothetical protein